MAWTQKDIDKLKAAIAEGALIVKYKDKSIQYRSLSEMREILAAMEKEVKGTPRTVRIQADFNKGLS